MPDNGFNNLNPVQQMMVASIHLAVDDRQAAFAPRIPADAPENLLSIIVVENVIQTAIEASLNQIGHFTPGAMAELAVRVASLFISVMPEEMHCDACEEVSRVLHETHHRRVEAGASIERQWLAPPAPEEIN